MTSPDERKQRKQVALEAIVHLRRHGMGNYEIAETLNLCDFPTLTGAGHWLGQTPARNRHGRR